MLKAIWIREKTKRKNSMKTINDIVETLTLEEKELFKDLIEECLEREKKIVETKEEIDSLTAKLVRYPWLKPWACPARDEGN